MVIVAFILGEVDLHSIFETETIFFVVVVVVVEGFVEGLVIRSTYTRYTAILVIVVACSP